jgi:hypothetical protein
MTRGRRFNSQKTITVGSVTVEIGKRSSRTAFRITLPNGTADGGSVFVAEEGTANDLADALDEAIDCADADPLLWVGLTG